MSDPRLFKWRSLRKDALGIIPVVLAGILALFGIGLLGVGWVFFRGLIILFFVGTFLLIITAGSMWALSKGIPLKPIAGLMVFILVFAGIVAFLAGGLFAVVSVDTDTKDGQSRGWAGTGALVGTSGDTTVRTGTERLELLSDNDYLASWDSDFNGQQVTFAGKIVAISTTWCTPYKYRYSVFLNTGSGWNRIQSDDQLVNWNSPILVSSFVFGSGGYQLKDQPHGAGLRVEMWVLWRAYSGDCFTDEWAKMATDEATILGGIGDIDFDKDLYQVGDTARITTRTNYATDGEGRGWVVTVFSQAQNRNVLDAVKVSSTVQTFTYLITASDFTNTTGCRNEIRAILTNEILDKDFDDAAVVDVASAAPTITIKGFTPPRPVQGDTVTVTWEAKPNVQTNLPLTKIVFRWGPGESQETILPPTDTSGSFVAGQATKYHVEAIVYDSGCRPNSDDLDVFVSEPGDDDDLPSGIPWLAILGLILLIAGAAVAVVWKNWRWVGLILLIVGALLVVLQFVPGVGAVAGLARRCREGPHSNSKTSVTSRRDAEP